MKLYSYYLNDQKWYAHGQCLPNRPELHYEPVTPLQAKGQTCVKCSKPFVQKRVKQTFVQEKMF